MDTDNSREKLMREVARCLLQTVYDTDEEARNAKILQLAKAYGVKINKGDE